MFNIKRNDIVQVIKGKDRGKKGKVLKILTEKNRAIVEGINMVKKHMRQRRQEQQKGIMSLEAPLAISNLMPFCKNCNRPTRPGFMFLSDGSKARICKKCKSTL